MFNFIKYYLQAKTKHSTKSAFAKTFLEAIWEDDRYYYAFDDMNSLSFWLERFKKSIPWNGEEKAIKEINQDLAITSELGQKLFYFAQANQKKNIVELGSGLNGVWMLQAVPNSKLHIIESNERWASMIRNYVNSQTWDTTISIDTALNEKVNIKTILPSIDVVILDLKRQLNHTVTTFTEILTYLGEDSVIIITNKQLNTKIWEMAKSYPKVKLTLDFYQVGFVFLKMKMLRHNIYD